MRVPLNTCIGIFWLASVCWVVLGHGMFTLPIRAAIVFGEMLILGLLVVPRVGVKERLQRHERNQDHCAKRGYSFIGDASINDVFHNASLFRNDKVRIEQLAHGKYGNAEFDVYDLSYKETSRSIEGGSTTYWVAQTVASFPEQGCADVKFVAVPVGGLLESGVLRFFGRMTSEAAAPIVDPDDRTLANWFTRNYIFWNDDPSQQQVEVPLHPPLLRWLRDHEHLAFEIVDRQLLVWRPCRLVDSTARDGLVEEGLQLATVIQQRHKWEGLALSIAPPAVIMLRWFILNFVPWISAVFAALLGMFGTIALGWAERAPKLTVSGVMAFAFAVWALSSILVFRLITSRPLRAPGPPDS